MHWLCRIGIHTWNRPTFLDQFSSNVREYRQRCNRCNKIVRWIQPKGLSIKFSVAYWSRRLHLFHLLVVLLLFFALVYFFWPRPEVMVFTAV